MDVGQKLSRFEDQVRQGTVATFPDAVLSVTARSPFRLKMRVDLSDTTFIDIFYNPRNDRTDFALIHNNRRIFGYDNLGGWHCHPVANPESHIPCEEPSINSVFQQIKACVEA